MEKFHSVIKRYWKTVCVIVGCWTFLALLFTPQTYLANLRSPAPLTWVQALVASLTLFYVWAVLTPLVLWLGRRFPFERHLLRGRWLPDSELRKMLENVAALNGAAASAKVATAKVDFSGTWTLDKSNSEGLPPGMDQIMTVVQTGDKLSLETKLITEQGEQVVPDSYMLDGKEVDFTPKTPGGQSGKGKRTAKWGADGNSIEVSENATFDYS